MAFKFQVLHSWTDIAFYCGVVVLVWFKNNAEDSVRTITLCLMTFLQLDSHLTGLLNVIG